MIVFCEDCGQKNSLDPAQFRDAGKKFRCTFCNYLNVNHSHALEKTRIEKTKIFSRETRFFPEIIGSFVFQRNIGVMENNMPEILKKSDLDILGNLLTKSYLAGQSRYRDINEMTVVISDRNMIVKRITPDVFLIIASKTIPLIQKVSDRLAELFTDTAAQNKMTIHGRT